MKKKLIALFMTGVMVTATGVSAGVIPVCAEGINENVEIRFNLGDSELSVNGSPISVPAPFVKGQGTTMVPLRVITEAFGAVVSWNGDEKKIDIQYGDLNIIMYIDQKEATIDGVPTQLTEAPVIEKDTTMVPLRFISEGFGAQVSYDEATKEITVTKEKDIDVSALLNVKAQQYIGDRYFGWSMKNSPSFSLTERNLDASELLFTDESGLCEIEALISTYPEDSDYTIEKAILYTKSILSSSTLISQKQDKKGDADYFEISAKNNDYTLHRKLYWRDKKLYAFTVYIDNEAEKKYIDTAMDCFASISLSYPGTEDILDLSDIGEDGTRKFEQTKLKLSMSLPAGWEQEETSDKINYFVFVNSGYGGKEDAITKITLQMFSREQGQTLEEWVKKDTDTLSDTYNPEFYKQSGITKRIGLYESKGFKEELKLNDKTKLNAEVFYIFGGAYRYQISFVCDSKVYNKQTAYNEIMNVINSFRFEEPDASEVGFLTEPDSIGAANDKITDEIKLDEYGISFRVPTLWKNISKGSYSDEYGNIILSVMEAQVQNLTEQDLRNVISSTSDAEIIELSMSGKQVGGKNVMYAKYKDKNSGYIVHQYIYKKSADKMLIILIYANDILYGQRTKTLMNDITNSAKFY